MTAPPVRPLPAEGDRPDEFRRRAPRLAAPLIAGLAAVLLLAWPNAEGGEQVEFAPIEPVITIAAPAPRIVNPLAVESFESFVGALNRGDTVATIELLAPEVPNVAGLGTVSYPLAENDPGLWRGSDLDATSVATFVEQASGIPGPVFISNCSAFGDGPKVTIVACNYAADGLIALPSFKPELGTLFGFMVDSTVAGVAYRTGEDNPGPIP